MLIPQNRLLWLVGLGLVPLAAVAGLMPGPVATVARAGAATLLALTAADAWLGGVRAGRALGFEFPAVVRLSQGRPDAVTVRVLNGAAGTPARRLRLGLAWPETVTTPTEEIFLPLAAGVVRTRLDWSCVPARRGRFALARIHYEESSPLGLWAWRRSAEAACELRVYPNLRAERRHATALFLPRGGLGIHRQRQVGRGREFEKLRDYVPGDSIEDVSWKATARRQRPVSKVFQVERTQEIYVLIDASRLSARGDTDGSDPGTDEVDAAASADAVPAAAAPAALERYLSSALLLCLAAERQGDRFGLVTFAEGVRQFVRAKNGRAHFDACREAIYALEPAAVSPDFEELCTFLRRRLRRRALLVVLTSSLDDPVLAESFTRAVGLISRQHLVLVNSLRPAGVEPLFADADGGAGVRTAQDVYRRLGGHLRWQRLRETGHRLRRLGVGFALLDEAHLTEELLAQYVSVKQRQVL